MSRFVECVSCGENMNGILCHGLRTTCHECGGKSNDEDRLAPVKEESLMREKSFGEISESYQFRKKE